MTSTYRIEFLFRSPFARISPPLPKAEAWRLWASGAGAIHVLAVR